MNVIVNKSGYKIPHHWLVEIRMCPIGTMTTKVYAGEFRGEIHLYCDWIADNGEVIDRVLGPGAKTGQPLEKL